MEAVEPVSIDLSDYFVDNAAVIAIDGCMQKSLIEAKYLTFVVTFFLMDTRDMPSESKNPEG